MDRQDRHTSLTRVTWMCCWQSFGITPWKSSIQIFSENTSRLQIYPCTHPLMPHLLTHTPVGIQKRPVYSEGFSLATNFAGTANALTHSLASVRPWSAYKCKGMYFLIIQDSGIFCSVSIRRVRACTRTPT